MILKIGIQQSTNLINLKTPKVPQSNFLFLDLYNIFTADIPQSTDILLAIHGDDTTVFISSANPNLVTNLLEDQANKIDTWAK